MKNLASEAALECADVAAPVGPECVSVARGWDVAVPECAGLECEVPVVPECGVLVDPACGVPACGAISPSRI